MISFLNAKTEFPVKDGDPVGVSESKVFSKCKDLISDLASNRFPAWHETALMIKNKYYEELRNAENKWDVVQENYDYIIAFYLKEVILNNIAAAFMSAFMKKGMRILKSKKIWIPGIGAIYTFQGLMWIIMAPPMADTIKDELSAISM